MPQLDKFTFAPQVLWLIIIFFVMYFTLLRTGLPRLYKILIFRKKKISFLNSSSVQLVEESFFYTNNLNKFLLNVVGKLRVLPDASFKLVESVLDITNAKESSYKERVRNILVSGQGVEYAKDRVDSAVILEKFKKV